MPTIQLNTKLQYLAFIIPHEKYFQPHAKKPEKWCQPGANELKLYPFKPLLENKKPSN